MRKCDICNKTLIKVGRRTELADLDEGATDGQIADYFAAELSGDYGAWGIGVVEYICPQCNRIFQVITDELLNYAPLIIGWHEKSKEGDYFSRFVFEYLAFIALLKNNLFFGMGSDRNAIQALKQDSARRIAYCADVSRYEPLSVLWGEVIAELGKTPLHNSSRDMDDPEIDKWWNNSGYEPAKDDKSPKGIVRALSDWENMVEYWYGVRNNLFHGGKNPNIRRDCFLVEHAYLTLASFVEHEVSQL